MNRSKWALLLAALLCIVQAVMPMTVFAFTAQTPTRVPEIGEAVTVYTKADMVLDFSSYTFSVMDSSGTEQSGGIHGLTNVMKQNCQPYRQLGFGIFQSCQRVLPHISEMMGIVLVTAHTGLQLRDYLTGNRCKLP